jgi:hypothetical protein
MKEGTIKENPHGIMGRLVAFKVRLGICHYILAKFHQYCSTLHNYSQFGSV